MDTNRLEQFAVTKRIYDKMPQVKEFIIPTRSELALARYLDDNDLMKDVRLFPYTIEEGFNPSKALNIGARNAKYDRLIITSPEVKPTTDVLAQFEALPNTNIICQVWDEDEEKNVAASLVHAGYRDTSPAMYFLACFNKADIESINGWDEEFMRGYAYEDDDFGARWNRAGLPFEIHEEIQGIHQYHPRSETISGGANINQALFNDNNNVQVVRCANGLEKIDI